MSASVRPLAATLADVLPIDMLELPRWLVWKRVQRGEGKPTKVPYNARTGRKGDVTDAATWATFSAALAAYRQKPGRYAGVGFVLGDGISGVDLDACREPETGELAPWALAIVRELAGYVEVSPSGTGVHIIARGALPSGGRRRGPVELYESDRFFTVTGETLADGVSSTGEARALPDRTDALAVLHARIFAPIETPASGQRSTAGARRRSAPPAPMQLADSELILKAHNARNGADFARLWSGDTAGYPSASEADMALIRRLSFWAGPDAARIDALYRQSGMYPARARKWDSRRGASTWGAQLIETVLATPGDSYTPPTASASASASARRSASGGPGGAPDVPPIAPADAAPSPIEQGEPGDELATRRRGSSRGTGGDSGAPDADTGLVELGEGLYCDAARTQLYRIKRERASTGTRKRGKRDASEPDDSEPDSESEDGEGWTVEPVRFPAGMPRLLAAYCVGGEPDGDVTELTTYRYEWSKLVERGAVTTTEKDLNSGAIHARTPGLAITSRRDRDFWADVVKHQVIAFNVPVGVAQDATGWHQHIASGLWERHLRDGRIVQRPDAPGVPIAGLRFDGPHRQAWESDMATLPTETPTGEGIERLAAFALRADPLGRLLITLGAAMRGSIATFAPVATALLPVGQSRAGKTISSNFARGIDGPCPPRARADCVFTGTIPGLESSIAPLHDEFVLIDDFHIKATDGPAEVAKLGNQLDMLITGGADGNDMRPRGSRTGKRRKESVVTAMLSLTGEGLPATTESRVLRAIILPYARGEMDTAYLLDGWSEYQRVWWSAGHAVMRWVGERVNDDMTAFRHDVEAQEAAYKAHLLAGLVQACPTVDREALDTLASGYARPALGLWLVTQACRLADASTDASAATLAATVLPFLLHYATIQARSIEMGGPGQASRQWILDALRAMPAEGRGHGLDMDNGELLKEAVPGSLADYGYSGAFPRGEHLFNRDAENGMTYWRTERLCAALADRAGRARPQPVPWPWNAQTLPGYLVKLGIVTPELDSAGVHRRAARLCYIATKRVRRLAISESLYIGEDENDTEDDATITTFPYRGCENSGSSGSSGSFDMSGRFIPESVYGTAAVPLQNASGSSGSIASGDTYLPDTVTYAPDADAEDGRERVGWGDEDADAAPYAPPSDTPDDPPDGEALAPVGLADTSHDPPTPYQKRYKPSELAADGTPYALMPRTESGVIE